MDDMHNERILKELQRISHLLVLSLTKEATKSETFELMNKVGFDTKEIADVANTSSESVRAILSQQRKQVTKNDKSKPS